MSGNVQVASAWSCKDCREGKECSEHLFTLPPTGFWFANLADKNTVDISQRHPTGVSPGKKRRPRDGKKEARMKGTGTSGISLARQSAIAH